MLTSNDFDLEAGLQLRSTKWSIDNNLTPLIIPTDLSPTTANNEIRRTGWIRSPFRSSNFFSHWRLLCWKDVYLCFSFFFFFIFVVWVQFWWLFAVNFLLAFIKHFWTLNFVLSLDRLFFLLIHLWISCWAFFIIATLFHMLIYLRVWFAGLDTLFTFPFLLFPFLNHFIFNFLFTFHVGLFYFFSFANSFAVFVFWLTAISALICTLSISFHILTRMLLPFVCTFSRLVLIKLLVNLLFRYFFRGDNRLRRTKCHKFLNNRIFVNILTKTEGKPKLILPSVGVRVTVFYKWKQDCHFPHI